MPVLALACHSAVPAPELVQVVDALPQPVEVDVYAHGGDGEFEPVRSYLDALGAGSARLVVRQRDLDRPWSWLDALAPATVPPEHTVVFSGAGHEERLRVRTAPSFGAEPLGSPTDFCDRLGDFEAEVDQALRAFLDEAPVGSGPPEPAPWSRRWWCRRHLGTRRGREVLPGTGPAPVALELGDVRAERVGPSPGLLRPTRAARLRVGGDVLELAMPNPVRPWSTSAGPIALAPEERARLAPDGGPELRIVLDDGSTLAYRVASWADPTRRLLVRGDEAWWVGPEELAMLEDPLARFGGDRIQPFARAEVVRVVDLRSRPLSFDLDPADWPDWLFDGRAVPEGAPGDPAACAIARELVVHDVSTRTWSVTLYQCAGDGYVSTTAHPELRRLVEGGAPVGR